MTPALRLRPATPVDDAADFGRRVIDTVVDGTSQLAKRADVPRLVETGRENAAAAVNDAVDRVTGRRRRRSRPIGPLILVAALLTLGLSAWWLLRSDAVAALRAIGRDDEFDDDELGAADVLPTVDPDALSTATDDGMAPAPVTAELVSISMSSTGGPDEPDAFR